MKLSLRFDDADWQANTATCVRWSTPLEPGGAQPNAFGLPRATSVPFRAGGFVGDTRQGGAVNCELVELAPHGNGTHTECVGHIVDARRSIADTLWQPCLVTQLVTVTPSMFGSTGEAYGAPNGLSDAVITRASLQAACGTSRNTPALAIRTNVAHERATFVWSGTNPPYLTDDATRWLVERGVRHLLLDVPSIDREEDAGVLPNHHRWWGVAPGARTVRADSRIDATITEMMDAPSSCPDGLYLVFVQIPGLALDAAPSRLLACPLTPSPAPAAAP